MAAEASPEEPEAEATRLAVGAAERDAANRRQWLQAELLQKNRKDLRVALRVHYSSMVSLWTLSGSAWWSTLRKRFDLK